MPWDIGAGIAGAAGAGAELVGDSIRRDRNLQDAGNLEALKAKVEQDKLDRIAGIVKGVSRETTASSFDAFGAPTTVTQRKSDSTYSRDVGDALTGAGFIDQGGKAYDRAERHDDKAELRSTQAAKQSSDEARWKASQEQAERFHKDTVRMQQQTLGLKQQDAKDFGKAVDSYIENKAQYERLVALKDDPDLITAVKQGMERDALKLRQFKVDVADSSPEARRIQLSASLTAATKIVDNPMSAAGTVELAKEAQKNILKEMASLTGSKSAVPAGAPQDVRVGGKVIGQAFTQAEADALVAKHKAGGSKPAAAAATPPFEGVTANVLRPEYGKGGLIQTREKL